MANVALIESVDRPSADTLVLSGTFTDNASFKQPFALTLQGVRTLDDVRARLNAALEIAEAQDTFKIAPGPFDLTIVPPVLTPEEQARVDYKADLFSYRRQIKAVAAGILPEIDPGVLSRLTKNYLASYESLLDILT